MSIFRCISFQILLTFNKIRAMLLSSHLVLQILKSKMIIVSISKVAKELNEMIFLNDDLEYLNLHLLFAI